MQCYRIISEAYHKSSYTSSASAGRWNPKGTRMIYAGSTPTVSLLEYLCIKGTTVARKPWFMVVYDISDETLVGTLDTTSLPPDWNVLPHGKATQDFGKVWLDEKEYPFLKVPIGKTRSCLLSFRVQHAHKSRLSGFDKPIKSRGHDPVQLSSESMGAIVLWSEALDGMDLPYSCVLFFQGSDILDEVNTHLESTDAIIEPNREVWAESLCPEISLV